MSFWADRSIFAKIVILLAIAFITGIGLCGADATLLAKLRDSHEEFGPNTMVGGIGAIAIVLSASGLLVTTVVWGAAALVRQKDPEPQVSATIPTIRRNRNSRMKAPWSNLEGPAKWLVIAVVALLVSSGLCGLQVAIMSGANPSGASLGSLFMFTGAVELIVMALSACAVVVSLIIWIATALYSHFSE